VPSVLFCAADSGHDSRRFACSQNRHHLIRLSFAKVRLDELVAAAFRRFEDGSTPLLGPVLHPIPELIGNVSENLATDRELIPVKAEEPDYSLGLLEWLQQPIQQDAVETPIARPDAMLMVLAEGVNA
jgi:hypothetical protein